MKFNWERLKKLDIRYLSVFVLLLAIVTTVFALQQQQTTQQYAGGGGSHRGNFGNYGRGDHSRPNPQPALRCPQCPSPIPPTELSCSTCRKSGKTTLCFDEVKKSASCGVVDKHVESEGVVCVSCVEKKPCQPRPACLDAKPVACKLPEPAGGWCPAPTPTKKPCQPRPACLDAEPACLLPEPAEGWCPLTPTPTEVPQ